MRHGSWGQLRHACTLKNVLMEHLYHKPLLDPEALFDTLMDYRDALTPYVGDAVTFVHEALSAGKQVLLEGQLGSMKDPDLGICPFTTSSHTLAGFGTVGGAVPPTAITDVVCVSKAYSSAVGAGAFVSELFGEEAEQLRRRGGDAGEYGATTGRPRRVGWFDAVATRYGCMVQGATEVVLTAIDCLGYLDEIKVCTGYEIDGKTTDVFPVPALLERAQARLHHAARLEMRYPRPDRLCQAASGGPGLCGLHRSAHWLSHQAGLHRPQASRDHPPQMTPRKRKPQSVALRLLF